jgi:hypothetical protein
VNRGRRAVAVVRVLSGRAAYPVPDGLPVLGIRTGGSAEVDHEDCDAVFSGEQGSPATLVTLPETAGAGGMRSAFRGERPVKRLSLTLDLLREPTALEATLRGAAPPRERSERLRIVDWTLRVGAWGDDLKTSGRDGLAMRLSRADEHHRFTILPHPQRFVEEEDGGNEPAAFLEALSHFDPLGAAETPGAPAPLSTLAGVSPDPERVRALATRFARPLLTTS